MFPKSLLRARPLRSKPLSTLRPLSTPSHLSPAKGAPANNTAGQSSTNTNANTTQSTPVKKTVQEADEELRQKLEAISGEGGEAGLELEGGKPVAMKRGVRENMFRVI